MKLEIKKINDKVQGLDVKGQGCKDDCPSGHWSGFMSAFSPGCKWVVDTPTAAITTAF